ncbi:hypothetical protein E2C01_062088 [Portunus trituberculatus]|uniref:Uncharacterized protein n=1 Tax=Portunus trituberculatus TaxID=210409 RepID=A0A5B7HA14_PORTR|nr:hypothetical protein [Portunus trituberculatus]
MLLDSSPRLRTRTDTDASQHTTNTNKVQFGISGGDSSPSLHEHLPRHMKRLGTFTNQAIQKALDRGLPASQHYLPGQPLPSTTPVYKVRVVLLKR